MSAAPDRKTVFQRYPAATMFVLALLGAVVTTGLEIGAVFLWGTPPAPFVVIVATPLVGISAGVLLGEHLGKVVTTITTGYCLTHDRPYDDLGNCSTFTGAPDARSCQPHCEACTGELVVDDPTSWPYCPECGWAPEAGEK